MGGKRRAQPSGKEEGTAAVSGGAAQGEGPPPRKRQTLGLRLDSDAGSADFRSCRKEGWGLVLAPMTMGLSMRCDPGELVGRKAALEAAVEAAVRIVVTEFGCQDVRVEWTRVGPSEDTLQRVLPLVMERVEPEGGALCFLVCKSWRRELESRGFCNRTVQLCSALAETGDADRLWHQAQRRLHRSMLPPDQDFCMEACAFLKKHSGGGKWSLREWLQATSQEPDASILSRGGLSTSLVLGLPLVGWVGKPQESYTGVYTLKGHSAYFVSSAAFSPDGKRVVTGAYDKLVKIWDVATGQEVMSLGEHNGRGICTCAGAINHEGAYDRTNPACPINGHLDIVSVVAFSPDGKRVVSGSGDHLVKIWNAETGAEVHTLRGHTGWATCVAFSPDGKRVVSGSYDQLVKIWDAATGQLVRTLTGHSASVVSLTFSPDGKRVVSGSWDKTVKIWDADTGAQVLTLTGDAGMVNSVACSPDGKFIVSGSDGKLVKIWDAATGAEIHSLGEHNGQGHCLCELDEDENVEEDEDGEKIIDPECPVTGHSGMVKRVVFSDDGKLVISGGKDNTVRVWDVASGRQVRQLAGNLFAMVEGPSDEHKTHRHVLTARGDTLLIYKVAKGQPHAEEGASGAPMACFKAPQCIKSLRCYGSAICVGCDGGAVCIVSAPFLSA